MLVRAAKTVSRNNLTVGNNICIINANKKGPHMLGKGKSRQPPGNGRHAYIDANGQQQCGSATEGRCEIRTHATAEVQKRLLELGYEAGTPDGVMGKKTADALRKFQQDNNIPVTGRPDSDTVSKLGSANRLR